MRHLLDAHSHVQKDLLLVLHVLVLQFITCLRRHVLGVVGVICLLLGLCLWYT